MAEQLKAFHNSNIDFHLIKHHRFFASLALAAIILVVLGDDLFKADGTVISLSGADTYNLFVYWRSFGFDQIRAGNIPLWNPHLFAGTPYLGGFESALFYPLNCIFLFLPLPIAINLSISIHLFLLGFFFYLWTSNRGLHPLACFFASAAIMLSGPSFTNVFAGQLIDLCTMAWTPLLFLLLDRLFERPSMRLCLGGIITVTMQILAGHPQYMFYTAITAMLYCSLRIISAPQKWTVFFIAPAIYAGACCLGAVQFFSAIDAAREGVRSAGVSYQFASSFSFPPENFLTLISPFFLGDMNTLPYWGRYYLFGMNLFIGISSLVMMICGVVYGEKQTCRSSHLMVVLLLILALGAHTPLFRLLYDYVPGFNLFRGTSKFIFLAVFFAVMLSAVGLDALLKNRTSTLNPVSILAASAIALGCAAILLYPMGTGSESLVFWKVITRFISSTGESYLDPQIFANLHFVRNAGKHAATSFIQPAVVLLFLALLFFRIKSSRRVAYLVAIVGIAEMLSFATTIRAEFQLKDTTAPALNELIRHHPGDYRVLNLRHSNSAMTIGAYDIWGYSPGVLHRYAEFIRFTQGYDPDQATSEVQFSGYHRLYAMLRLRFIYYPEGNQWRIREYPDVMPRLNLIANYSVRRGRNNLFSEMEKPTFDPRRTVLLEKVPPFPSSQTEAQGTCRLLETSTDHMLIHAWTKENSLLLITDNYSRGWRADALNGSSQSTYEIMPANYTLMAIALSPGEHRIKLEYKPKAFQWGIGLSILSLCICLFYMVWLIRKWLQTRK